MRSRDKDELAKRPVLKSPRSQTHLQTDASDAGLGAVLTQVHDGVEQVVMYASRTLQTTEKSGQYGRKKP